MAGSTANGSNAVFGISTLKLTLESSKKSAILYVSCVQGLGSHSLSVNPNSVTYQLETLKYTDDSLASVYSLGLSYTLDLCVPRECPTESSDWIRPKWNGPSSPPTLTPTILVTVTLPHLTALMDLIVQALKCKPCLTTISGWSMIQARSHFFLMNPQTHKNQECLKMKRKKRRRVAEDARRDEERQLRATSTDREKLGMERVCLLTCFHAFASQMLKTDSGCPQDIFCCYFWQLIYKLENYKCKLQPQRASANEGTVHKLPILICLLACVKTKARGSWGNSNCSKKLTES